MKLIEVGKIKLRNPIGDDEEMSICVPASTQIEKQKEKIIEEISKIRATNMSIDILKNLKERKNKEI